MNANYFLGLENVEEASSLWPAAGCRFHKKMPAAWNPVALPVYSTLAALKSPRYILDVVNQTCWPVNYETETHPSCRDYLLGLFTVQTLLHGYPWVERGRGTIPGSQRFVQTGSGFAGWFPIGTVLVSESS
jgi:hypothetical protein